MSRVGYCFFCTILFLFSNSIVGQRNYLGVELGCQSSKTFLFNSGLNYTFRQNMIGEIVELGLENDIKYKATGYRYGARVLINLSRWMRLNAGLSQVFYNGDYGKYRFLRPEIGLSWQFVYSAHGNCYFNFIFGKNGFNNTIPFFLSPNTFRLSVSTNIRGVVELFGLYN